MQYSRIIKYIHYTLISICNIFTYYIYIYIYMYILIEITDH